MKRIIIGLVCVLMTMTCALPAYALGSTDINGAVSGEVLVNGEVVNGSKAEFTAVENVVEEIEDETVVESIVKLNEGSKLEEVLNTTEVALPENTEVKVEELAMLTVLQDLKAYDEQGNVIEGPVTLTWEVPNLSEEAGDVYVLHYSTVRNVWEVLPVDSVDYSNNTVTCSFEDLSPVSVVYKKGEAVVETTQPTVAPTQAPVENTPVETPSEATSSNTGMFVGIGVVAVVVICGVVYLKTKKK